MSKKTPKRRVTPREQETIAEQARRDAKLRLRKTLRGEREIHGLMRQVRRAVETTDRQLREFTQFIGERDGDRANV